MRCVLWWALRIAVCMHVVWVFSLLFLLLRLVSRRTSCLCSSPSSVIICPWKTEYLIYKLDLAFHVNDLWNWRYKFSRYLIKVFEAVRLTWLSGIMYFPLGLQMLHRCPCGLLEPLVFISLYCKTVWWQWAAFLYVIVFNNLTTDCNESASCCEL